MTIIITIYSVGRFCVFAILFIHLKMLHEMRVRQSAKTSKEALLSLDSCVHTKTYSIWHFINTHTRMS